jgi:hypothetical protein
MSGDWLRVGQHRKRVPGTYQKPRSGESSLLYRQHVAQGTTMYSPVRLLRRSRPPVIGKGRQARVPLSTGERKQPPSSPTRSVWTRGSTDARASGDFCIAQGKQSSRSLEPTRLDVVPCERHVALRGDARSRREAAVGYGLVPSQALGPLTPGPMCARPARGLLGVLRRPPAPPARNSGSSSSNRLGLPSYVSLAGHRGGTICRTR